MEWVIRISVCLLAGLGAGAGTGFAGMSAAAVVAPLLMTFLGIPAYTAVGIGLASDVLASAASALMYHKHRNLDIRNGLVMMVAVLAFTVVGSLVAGAVPETAMSNTSLVMMVLIGLRFLIRPVMTTKAQMASLTPRRRLLGSVIGGVIVGFICGFVGAGGGMMMLFVLTTFLGYELHVAVGTSVFIMAFTALTGSVSHFAIGGMPDVPVLLLCMGFTLLFAMIASRIANRASARVLNRVVGTVLILTGIAVIAVRISRGI